MRDVPRGEAQERGDAMSAIRDAIEEQIRGLRRAIERRPDLDELVVRLEDREPTLARVRETIAAEVRST